ncbi:hypothetical protein NIES4102_37990 [Chondrocystis sp. NIES-4102]|nr:hypothetical protein NIES4102_37990 [Chondrocystis sp. NIES-4102]
MRPLSNNVNSMTTKLTGYVWFKVQGKGEKGIFFVITINEFELNFLEMSQKYLWSN